ncbi:MAG: amidase [Gammaproteobacteria bacterium]|nr:amidase [Gammaproteobacteria bacterium]MYC98820.1 amidase [Gammaproteobacteria bacterium]
MSSRDRDLAVEGLRANLRTAGIPAREEDIERVVEEGIPDRAVAFRALLAATGGDCIPDALSGWSLAGFAAYGEAKPAPGAADGPPQADGPCQSAARARPESAPWPSTIAELAPLVRAGAVSPVELTEEALARIEEGDGRANAFQLVLAEKALAAARRAEDEVARGDWRGPLHGIPVAVKDLLAMKDTVTTSGSKVLADHVTDHDAAVVERLRAAGAVIVGKTRLSEFAYWPGSTNPHYGPTPNPRDPTRDAGGSSSGSAAAVARGTVYAALGTDTGGSIRIPAALCGVVGLKPTFGRASLHGCAPLAWSLDHVGPLARSVEDAALVLAAIAGPDPRDPRTRPAPPLAVAGLPGDPSGGTGRLHPDLPGVRVGVPRDLHLAAPLQDAVLRSWARANRALEGAGATLVEVDLDEIHMLRQVAVLTLGVEAAAHHAPLLRAHYDDYGEFSRGRLVAAFTFSAQDFLGAQRLRHWIRVRWDGACRHVDLLSLPCQPGVAPLLDMPASTDLTNLFNALGWPAISVPCGEGEHGLPLAVQFAAKPWDEATLLRAARAIEA